MSLNWLNKGVAKVKANWDASQEKAKQRAIQDKAIRDEARAVYQSELEKQRKKAIEKVAFEKAKLDAKLQAQKLFAPRQNALGRVLGNPSEKVNQNLNASLSALVGTPNPKKVQSLKSKIKKGTPKSSFDDLVWKY